jgi:DNA-binding response OmpR family regulator
VTVLMLGRHLELGHYRAEFLTSHGINVIFPENEEAAFAAVRNGGYDVVVLSYSLPDFMAKELTALLQQSAPQCPLISISEKRWSDRELKPDATVLSTDPPQALLDAIQRVRRPGDAGIRRIK